MKRQPNPDDPAYRDKSTKKKLDSKKTKTPGQQLEKSGDYIDTGELDKSGNRLMIQGDRDLTVQQGINRDKERYGPTDELIRQGKLKEVWDKHPDNPKNKNINRFKQLLMIGAGGAAIVSKGLKSLLINPLGGAM